MEELSYASYATLNSNFFIGIPSYEVTELRSYAGASSGILLAISRKKRYGLILYLKTQQKMRPAKRFDIFTPRQHGLLCIAITIYNVDAMHVHVIVHCARR